MASPPHSLEDLLSVFSGTGAGDQIRLTLGDINASLASHGFGDLRIAQDGIEVNYRLSDFGNPDYEESLQRSHQAYMAALKELLAEEQKLLNYGVNTELNLQRTISMVPKHVLAVALPFMRCHMFFRSLLNFHPSWRRYSHHLIDSGLARESAYTVMSTVWRGVAVMLEELHQPAAVAGEIGVLYARLSSSAGNNSKCMQRIMGLVDGPAAAKES